MNPMIQAFQNDGCIDELHLLLLYYLHILPKHVENQSYLRRQDDPPSSFNTLSLSLLSIINDRMGRSLSLCMDHGGEW